jgi:hypothetical protein
LRRLRTLLAGIGNVYPAIKSERHARFQALLSLGDRRVARAIDAAEQNGGDWRRAAADAGIDVDFYVARDRRQDLLLPWDSIAGGPPQAFLRAELARSLLQESTVTPSVPTVT